MSYGRQVTGTGHPNPQDHDVLWPTSGAASELCVRQHKHRERANHARDGRRSGSKDRSRVEVTAWRLAEDRHSKAEDAQLLTDPDEIARREAENGLRQFNLAIEIIATYVRDRERPFKLRAGPILQLHKAALDGLHRLAGTFRNTPVKIGGSPHQPPEAAFVSDEVQLMCEYINENWST